MASMPLATLVDNVGADVAELCRSIETAHNGEDRAALHRVNAQLAVLMAMALTDLGDVPAGQRWWRTARQTAEAIGDDELRAWICGRWALSCQSVELLPQAARRAAQAESLAAGRPWVGLAEAFAAQAGVLAAQGDVRRALSAVQKLTTLVGELPLAERTEEPAIWRWPERRLRSIRTHVRELLAGKLPADPKLWEDLRAEVAGLGPGEVRAHVHADLKRSRILLCDGHVGQGLSYAESALQRLPRDQVTTTIIALARRVRDAVPCADESQAAQRVRGLVSGLASSASADGVFG
jgi:hypothetical protein